MRAAIVTKYGMKLPEFVSDFPVPTPNPDDLFIKVKAASINPIDWKLMQGAMNALLKRPVPFVLGNDGAGVVEKVGSAVTTFKPGDEVYYRPGKDRIGTFGDYTLIRANEAALKPKSASWEEAAGLPLVCLTSWQALFDKASLKSGQRVLIHAGSGGVGTAAIQLAKNAGAYVITTCGPAGVELCKRMGADEIVNYREQKFEDVVKGVDVVFDTLGGESISKSFPLLNPGGVLVTVHGIPTPDVAVRYNKGFMLKTIFKLANIKNHSMAKKAKGRFEYLLMQAHAEQLTKIAKLFDEKKLVAVTDRTYPIEKVGEAFEYAMTGRAKGKVILTF